MLAHHFKSRAAVNRLNGPAAPFLDRFVQTLEIKGYADRTIRYHVGAVHHLCSWASAKSLDLSAFDDGCFQSFRRHLPSCRCILGYRGKFMHHARSSIALFARHLREIGVLAAVKSDEKDDPLLASFHHWMLNHRGVTESTLQIYDRFIPALLQTVDGDAQRIDAGTLQCFFAQRTEPFYQGYASNIANAIRVFIRYLIGEGISPSGLLALIEPGAEHMGGRADVHATQRAAVIRAYVHFVPRHDVDGDATAMAAYAARDCRLRHHEDNDDGLGVLPLRLSCCRSCSCSTWRCCSSDRARTSFKPSSPVLGAMALGAAVAGHIR